MVTGFDPMLTPLGSRPEGAPVELRPEAAPPASEPMPTPLGPHRSCRGRERRAARLVG